MPPVPQPPAASVVVATHNRAWALPRLLAALERQEGVDHFEVIVVDDGSTDETRVELERLRSQFRMPVEALHLEENAGPACARNQGWRAARAPVVAFTDDDCVPQPEWLAQLLSASDDADVVQGRTESDPDQGPATGPFSHTVSVEGAQGYYETCNIAYSRALLERLGGFDERFRYAYGEDVDLGWRARDAGARITFESNAVVIHDVRPTKFLNYLRGTRRLDGVPLVVRAHPELRAHLYRRYFYRPYHPAALVALAALSLVSRRPRSIGAWLAGAALLAPYVGIRSSGAWEPGRLAVLPLAFAADIAEIGSLAVASIRWRTLVL
jgi:GT2 family glycosyltransferase